MVNFSRAVWAVGPITKLGNSPRGGRKQHWKYKCWLLHCGRWNWGVRGGRQDCPQSLCPTGDRTLCSPSARGWEIIPVVGDKGQHWPTSEHLEFCCSSGISMARDKLCEHTCHELDGKLELTGPLFYPFWDNVGQLFCRFQRSFVGYSMERNIFIDKENNLYWDLCRWCIFHM